MILILLPEFKKVLLCHMVFIFPLAAFLIQNHFRYYILHLQFAVNAASCTLPPNL